MQGPTFTPVASEPMLIPGAAGAPASIQGMALPPMAVAPMLSQGMPVTGAYMDPPSWPMCMPSFLPQTQVTPPTTLSECGYLLYNRQRQELEATELEVNFVQPYEYQLDSLL